MDLTLRIGELEGAGAVHWEGYFLKWNQDGPVLGSVIVAQLEIPSTELRVPSNAVEQLVYRDHVVKECPPSLGHEVSGCSGRKVRKQQMIAPARELVQDESLEPAQDEARAPV